MLQLGTMRQNKWFVLSMCVVLSSAHTALAVDSAPAVEKGSCQSTGFNPPMLICERGVGKNCSKYSLLCVYECGYAYAGGQSYCPPGFESILPSTICADLLGQNFSKRLAKMHPSGASEGYVYAHECEAEKDRFQVYDDFGCPSPEGRELSEAAAVLCPKGRLDIEVGCRKLNTQEHMENSGATIGPLSLQFQKATPYYQ
jgi:hypothetical protein